MADPTPLHDQRRLDQVLAQQLAREQKVQRPLATSGDGGDSNGMDARVTALETHMQYVRKDLDEIKDSLKVLPTLATRRDLATFSLTGIGLALAVVAIIIGGLGWLETRTSRVQGPSPATAPIVIQVPAYSPPVVRK